MEKEFVNDNKIHILDNYYMTSDANQFVLIKEVTRKQRKTEATYTQFVTVGYYSSVQDLCKRLIKDATREGVQTGSLQSLRDIVSNIESLTERIEKIIQF